MGELRDVLYYFRALNIPIVATNITSNLYITLWHQHFEHLS